MKKIFYLITGLLIMASCQQDVVYEVDYNITLDPENTYYVGDPVKFNIDGQVDNLLFYSGEIGSQYIYKDRYNVNAEDIKSAKLTLDIMGAYGEYGCLEVWVSNTFTGLTGVDGYADRATIKAMVDNNMEGWTKFPYEDLEVNKENYATFEFPLDQFMDNMTVAFHWCPRTPEKTQRRYWIKGYIDVDIEGTEPVSQTLRDLTFVKIMMNEEVEPLHNPKDDSTADGTMRIPQPKDGVYKDDQHIIMKSIGAGKLTYAIDGWVISQPRSLNKVANDKGTVIKDLQNYLHSYEYVWSKPGTYKVTFLGRNENYAAASEDIQEFTITILEKPEE